MTAYFTETARASYAVAQDAPDIYRYIVDKDSEVFCTSSLLNALQHCCGGNQCTEFVLPSGRAFCVLAGQAIDDKLIQSIENLS